MKVREALTYATILAGAAYFFNFAVPGMNHVHMISFEYNKASRAQVITNPFANFGSFTYVIRK